MVQKTIRRPNEIQKASNALQNEELILRKELEKARAEKEAENLFYQDMLQEQMSERQTRKVSKKQEEIAERERAAWEATQADMHDQQSKLVKQMEIMELKQQQYHQAQISHVQEYISLRFEKFAEKVSTTTPAAAAMTLFKVQSPVVIAECLARSTSQTKKAAKKLNAKLGREMQRLEREIESRIRAEAFEQEADLERKSKIRDVKESQRIQIQGRIQDRQDRLNEKVRKNPRPFL